MNSTFLIGMAGRITSDKHQDLIINLANKKKNYFRKKKIIFHLAGDGDLINSLKKKVKFLNIEDLVKFDGYLNENKLITWFKKLQIYLHLSKDETTSTSILQAMSLSLPVVASKIGGNKNFLKYYNKYPNILLTKNNIDNVFLNIEKLINNRSKRIMMSKLSRKTAIEIYSSERMFKEYEKLF